MGNKPWRDKDSSIILRRKIQTISFVVLQIQKRKTLTLWTASRSKIQSKRFLGSVHEGHCFVPQEWISEMRMLGVNWLNLAILQTIGQCCSVLNLRLVCLQSLCNDGLRKNVIDAYKKEIIQVRFDIAALNSIIILHLFLLPLSLSFTRKKKHHSTTTSSSSSSPLSNAVTSPPGLRHRAFAHPLLLGALRSFRRRAKSSGDR